MISNRDGHVRVLPLHVANKIAAGEVVERPASVVKELVENAIDAGAKNIKISISQGGRKLVSVQDDGCGMTKDDAVLSLERQATSKILDVTDIEQIDTLGFRGEAIPSIASVSRFTLTTRRHDSDEGTQLVVNAGTLAEVRSAGCPPGTQVEVRDLFCNVPARRKFLRAYVTEENHVKGIFTAHALAHFGVGFTLVIDGRELWRLAPAKSLSDRVADLFGGEFVETMATLSGECGQVKVTGFIERPNPNTPTRRDQYVFINGRPASAPSIAYALRESYPRQAGDVRPAAVVFVTLPADMVDVNVHPTKHEVRFRDNVAVKNAVIAAVERALRTPGLIEPVAAHVVETAPQVPATPVAPVVAQEVPKTIPAAQSVVPIAPMPTLPPTPAPAPVQVEFAVDADSPRSRPWQWFRFLAQSGAGYLLVETDSGIVTINPIAARERVVYERLLANSRRSAKTTDAAVFSQALLIPETVQMSPVEAARVNASIAAIRAMGFAIEEFGTGVFKVDAVPQIIGSGSVASILSTIARDLSENGSRRSGECWREELIAKSIARSFVGASAAMTPEGATQLVEDLCRCRMPYVCPRGKPVMIFTSNRELNRKFDRG